MTYYGAFDTDFIGGTEYKVGESGSHLGAIMRGMAEIWRWIELSGEDVSEVVQYDGPDGVRLVPVTDGCFWDHGIVIKIID